MSKPQSSSPDQQNLFKLYHKNYLLGLLKQVHDASQTDSNEKLDAHGYLAYRRTTIAVEVSLLLMQ